MDNEDNVIKLKRKPAEDGSAEPAIEGLCLCCPFCDGAEWGVNVDPELGAVDYLICTSDECDGDSFVEVIDGVLADHVESYSSDIRFEPDNDD